VFLCAYVCINVKLSTFGHFYAISASIADRRGPKTVLYMIQLPANPIYAAVSTCTSSSTSDACAPPAAGDIDAIPDTVPVSESEPTLESSSASATASFVVPVWLEVRTDDQQDVYYFNEHTGDSAWEPPADWFRALDGTVYTYVLYICDARACACGLNSNSCAWDHDMYRS
jgi:hypothetical protein